MALKDKKSGKALRVIIARVVEADYKLISESGEFGFEWHEEIENEVFKIYLKDQSDNILLAGPLGRVRLFGTPECEGSQITADSGSEKETALYLSVRSSCLTGMSLSQIGSLVGCAI
jgi:hypothetical protein